MRFENIFFCQGFLKLLKYFLFYFSTFSLPETRKSTCLLFITVSCLCYWYFLFEGFVCFDILWWSPSHVIFSTSSWQLLPCESFQHISIMWIFEKFKLIGEGVNEKDGDALQLAFSLNFWKQKLQNPIREAATGFLISYQFSNDNRLTKLSVFLPQALHNKSFNSKLVISIFPNLFFFHLRSNVF